MSLANAAIILLGQAGQAIAHTTAQAVTDTTQTTTITTFSSQLACAYIGAHLIRFLKKASWFPLMQEHWEWLNKSFAAVIAFIVSTGIHYTVEWGLLATGAHEFNLRVTIPAAAVLLSTIWATIIQYCMQDAGGKLISAALPTDIKDSI